MNEQLKVVPLQPGRVEKSIEAESKCGFVRGEVVALRSGGGTMTIRYLPKKSKATITVDYQDDVGNACTAEYYPYQLQSCEELEDEGDELEVEVTSDTPHAG